MNVDLRGKTAFVTGAANGIGKAAAAAFVKAGANVVFSDVDGVAAQRAAQEFPETVAIGCALDVTRPEDVTRGVDLAVQRFGSLDILFQAAGLFAVRAIEDISPSSFERIWRVNVLGTVLMMQGCARRMMIQGRGGKIVNVASTAGRQGSAKMLEYYASKAAVISATQSAARELITHGICVNAIAPGIIATDMYVQVRKEWGGRVMNLEPEEFEQRMKSLIPAGRLGSPDDLLGAVLFLASPASDYVIGQTLNIDGGGISN